MVSGELPAPNGLREMFLSSLNEIGTGLDRDDSVALLEVEDRVRALVHADVGNCIRHTVPPIV